MHRYKRGMYFSLRYLIFIINLSITLPDFCSENYFRVNIYLKNFLNNYLEERNKKLNKKESKSAIRLCLCKLNISV